MKLVHPIVVLGEIRGISKLICALFASGMVLVAAAGQPNDRVSLSAFRLAKEDTSYKEPITKLPSTEMQALRRLGARLFFDRRLSSDGSISCATCHIPERAFQDGKPVAVGISGAIGVRNTPSLINVSMVPNLFWDGRRDSLESQAADPFVHPKEHGLTNEGQLVHLLRSDSEYQRAFGRQTPTKLAAHAYAALAAFERSLISRNSPFDRFWQRFDVAALALPEQRGFELFKGRAGCISCHTIDEQHLDFTDNRFHAIGLSLNNNGEQLPTLIRLVLDKPSLSASELLAKNPDLAILGRFAATRAPADIGAYRTPSLRNVAETAPYMHDGTVLTLEAAIDREVYYRGQRDGQPLVLTLDERKDLIAFLRSLSTTDLPLLAEQAYRDAGRPPSGRN